MTNPFAEAHVLEMAHKEFTRRSNAWTGSDGEPLTGAEVASNIRAVKARLEDHGWVTRFGPDPELPDVAESASLTTMARTAWQFVRELLRKGPETLVYAVYEAGDSDTRNRTTRILDCILSARSGVDNVFYSAWADRRTRTWDEVADLLDAAESFARTYGPAS